MSTRTKQTARPLSLPKMFLLFHYCFTTVSLLTCCWCSRQPSNTSSQEATPAKINALTGFQYVGGNDTEGDILKENVQDASTLAEAGLDYVNEVFAELFNTTKVPVQCMDTSRSIFPNKRPLTSSVWNRRTRCTSNTFSVGGVNVLSYSQES